MLTKVISREPLNIQNVAVFICISFLLMFSLSSSANSQDFSVDPMIFVDELRPSNKTIERSILVTNRSGAQKEIVIEVVELTQTPRSLGAFSYEQLSASQTSNKRSSADWFIQKEQAVLLEPFQSKEVTFVARLPNNFGVQGTFYSAFLVKEGRNIPRQSESRTQAQQTLKIHFQFLVPVIFEFGSSGPNNYNFEFSDVSLVTLSDDLQRENLVLQARIKNSGSNYTKFTLRIVLERFVASQSGVSSWRTVLRKELPEFSLLPQAFSVLDEDLSQLVMKTGEYRLKYSAVVGRRVVQKGIVDGLKLFGNQVDKYASDELDVLPIFVERLTDPQVVEKTTKRHRMKFVISNISDEVILARQIQTPPEGGNAKAKKYETQISPASFVLPINGTKQIDLVATVGQETFNNQLFLFPEATLEFSSIENPDSSRSKVSLKGILENPAGRAEDRVFKARLYDVEIAPVTGRKNIHVLSLALENAGAAVFANNVFAVVKNYEGEVIYNGRSPLGGRPKELFPGDRTDIQMALDLNEYVNGVYAVDFLQNATQLLGTVKIKVNKDHSAGRISAAIES